MTNQPKLPTAAEALDTNEIYAPEVLGVLLGHLEDDGDLDTAAKIIRKQIDNSTKAKQEATARSNQLYSQKAYARRQVAEAEADIKKLWEKRDALEQEDTTLKGVIETETRRLTALTARLRQVEPS